MDHGARRLPVLLCGLRNNGELLRLLRAAYGGSGHDQCGVRCGLAHFRVGDGGLGLARWDAKERRQAVQDARGRGFQFHPSAGRGSRRIQSKHQVHGVVTRHRVHGPAIFGELRLIQGNARVYIDDIARDLGAVARRVAQAMPDELGDDDLRAGIGGYVGVVPK
jgi:hypothetical protein